MAVDTYRALAAASVRSQASAPRLFAMRMTGEALVIIIEAIAIVTLADRFGSIAGWSASEVVLLMTLGRAGEGLALISARGIEAVTFAETVRTGRFDQVLTQPVPVLGWLLTSDIQLRNAGRVIGSLVIGVWAMTRIPGGLTVANIGLCLLSMVCCAALVVAILVLGAAATFVTIEAFDFANLMSNGGVALASFPLGIYNGSLRFFFTFVIPVGLAVYAPMLAITGRDGPGVLTPGLVWAVPLITAAFCAVTALGWRAGLRHYQSSGS